MRRVMQKSYAHAGGDMCMHSAVSRPSADSFNRGPSDRWCHPSGIRVPRRIASEPVLREAVIRQLAVGNYRPDSKITYRRGS